LFKYRGIDLITIENFEKEGVRTYDQASKRLKGLNMPLNFDTPKYHVSILDGHPAEADCAIFVVAPDTLPQVNEYHGLPDGLSHAKQLIVLINKMDVSGWSELQFGKAVQEFTTYLENNGVEAAEVPFIPVSALNGDNLIELSPRCSWYNGWVKHGQGEPRSGTTLLEALDTSFGA